MLQVIVNSVRGTFQSCEFVAGLCKSFIKHDNNMGKNNSMWKLSIFNDFWVGAISILRKDHLVEYRHDSSDAQIIFFFVSYHLDV